MNELHNSCHLTLDDINQPKKTNSFTLHYTPQKNVSWGFWDKEYHLKKKKKVSLTKLLKKYTKKLKAFFITYLKG